MENNIVSVERVSEYADTAKEVSAAAGAHTPTHTHTQTQTVFLFSTHSLSWSDSGQLEYRGQLPACSLAPERDHRVPGLWATVQERPGAGSEGHHPANQRKREGEWATYQGNIELWLTHL